VRSAQLGWTATAATPSGFSSLTIGMRPLALDQTGSFPCRIIRDDLRTGTISLGLEPSANTLRLSASEVARRSWNSEDR
jgi:hypothetical protein